MIWFFFTSLMVLAITANNGIHYVNKEIHHNAHYSLPPQFEKSLNNFNPFSREESWCAFAEAESCDNSGIVLSVDDFMNSIVKVEKKQHVKRERVSPGCNCRFANNNIDLGDGFYPRYLKNVTCQNEKCSGNTYCAPTMYPVTVLARRTIGFPENHSEPGYTLLPRELRRCWKFHTVKDIVADCMCAYTFLN